MGKRISTKGLQISLNKYLSEKGSVEKQLQESADFNLSIEWQPADGFVVIDNSANNGMLESCIEIIIKKGTLTHEDYLKTCI